MGKFEEYKKITFNNRIMLTPESILKSTFGYEPFNARNDTINLQELIMITNIPRYIVWSTDRLQLDDPFQRRWLLQQTLTRGRAEDIRKLSLNEITLELDNLNLPGEVYSLWKRYLEYRNVGK